MLEEGRVVGAGPVPASVQGGECVSGDGGPQILVIVSGEGDGTQDLGGIRRMDVSVRVVLGEASVGLLALGTIPAWPHPRDAGGAAWTLCKAHLGPPTQPHPVLSCPGGGGRDEGMVGDRLAGKVGKHQLPPAWRCPLTGQKSPPTNPPNWGAALLVKTLRLHLLLVSPTAGKTPLLGPSLSHPPSCPWRQRGGRAGYGEPNVHLPPRSASQTEDRAPGS